MNGNPRMLECQLGRREEGLLTWTAGGGKEEGCFTTSKEPWVIPQTTHERDTRVTLLPTQYRATPRHEGAGFRIGPSKSVFYSVYQPRMDLHNPDSFEMAHV